MGRAVIRWLLPSILIATTALAAPPLRQTVQRTGKGAADKDIRIGVYINVRPDCTSGELPTLRIVTPPAHGKITVKRAKVNATNYKQCLALEVPAYVGFYRSQPNFDGEDSFSIEVRFPAGRTELQQFRITIGRPGGEPI